MIFAISVWVTMHTVKSEHTQLLNDLRERVILACICFFEFGLDFVDFPSSVHIFHIPFLLLLT